MKSRTIDSFFKKKDAQGTTSSNQEVTAKDTTPQELPPIPETCKQTRPSKIPRVGTDTIVLSKLEFDPALQLLTSYNNEVKDVYKNAPQNAMYTSPLTQKEILQVYASRVRNAIHEEISDGKFCILVDEARDESKKEQMAIVLRFVDKEGFVKERFFDLVHGYDGASNMRGEFNGLQALILKECKYSYYVHCFVHRLQLALIAASRKVADVHQFFKDLIDIVNVVFASSKCHDELQEAHKVELERLISLNEQQTDTGMNQVGTLQ
ncbi:hypothetical protein COLO4_16085 [Corchorus olitorius]|uniref:DUF4371 domain-containing protein n=1 Tax=Corchorus olitorius TaxID=93759 RepID=A0A1R3JJR5_9ROSI|nr:hypothetical protein COLO4_16085 [Corchorus olitorius]